MKIIERSEHPEQFTIMDLKKGDVFRLPTGATVYLKIGASDTPYNNVNLANGILGTIREDYDGLLKVKGAYVENYKVDDDIDAVKEQLAAKSQQCKEMWDGAQDLKKEYWKLDKQIKEQEKQLSENQKTIKKLEVERDRLKSTNADLEKAYKNDVHDSDTLFKQIIDAAYLGEMKGWEDEIIANPQRLVEKIRTLAIMVQLNKDDTSKL